MDPFDLRLHQRLARLEAAAPEPQVARSRRKTLRAQVAHRSLLVAAVFIVAAFAAGGAVGRYIAPNEAIGHPGLENPGEPFYGAGLQCMTPPQADAVIKAKGFEVSWQIENRDAEGNGTTIISTLPPPAGVVEAGFVQGNTAHVVVSIGSGAQPYDWCK